MIELHDCLRIGIYKSKITTATKCILDHHENIEQGFRLGCR